MLIVSIIIKQCLSRCHYRTIWPRKILHLRLAKALTSITSYNTLRDQNIDYIPVYSPALRNGSSALIRFVWIFGISFANECISCTGMTTKYDSEPREGDIGDVTPDSLMQYLNQGEDDQMTMIGYTRSLFKSILIWTCIVLTLGLLRLVFYWKPNWFLKATHTPSNIQDATQVLLKDQYNQEFVENVKLNTQAGVTEDSIFASFNRGAGDKYGDGSTALLSSGQNNGSTYVRYFVNKKIKYVFNYRVGTYKRLSGLESERKCSYFYELGPLDVPTLNQRLVQYGRNLLEVHLTPIYLLVLKQVINPFYVFQLFACILWYTDHYEYYASAILLISTGSIAVTTYTTRKMERALKSTIHVSGGATVQRKDEHEELYTRSIDPKDLVPGDFIEIHRNGMTMDVDAVLISGNAIMNESMLTGESVPVTKTPLPNPRDRAMMYDIKHHAKHTLFCGTKVLQARYYGGKPVTAVVIRTGFMTAKGDLVRSIIFPKPVDFKFYQETYKFMGVLAGMAGIGMIFTLVLMLQRMKQQADAGEEKYDPGLIVRRMLDLITICVPPALPAALAVGIVIGQSRLKNRCKIFCIQPSFINIAGSINVVCFDKTGTLTEEGLDMYGVLPVSHSDKRFKEFNKEPKSLPHIDHMKQGMATCHSLTRIEGELAGDPLDLNIFESTGFILEEPGEETNRYDCIMPTVVKPAQQNSQEVEETGILRQFTFSSSIQRMSVITRRLAETSFRLYMKGSPEMVASLCDPETVPIDFQKKLAVYTQSGYRVIALCQRELDSTYAKLQRVDRSEVEKDMQFLGLIVLENRLKPITLTVIDELQKARIPPIMVTGDNMLTAISVAQEAGFVSSCEKVVLVQADEHCDVTYHITTSEENEADQKLRNQVSIEMNSSLRYAMTGQTWARLRYNQPKLLEKITNRGVIFARMAPEQKSQLVETLQGLGYYVAMCGDGANDCGALKTAHAGISLSEAEASVASPFTSKKADISCVPNLIKEGRAALVTSFGQFKFIAGYSITQFASVLLLYWIGASLTDFEFLYIDLVLITSLGITCAYTGSSETLYHHPPPVRLASLLPITSLICHTIIITGVQAAAMFLLYTQDWFVKFEKNLDEDYRSYENTAVFDVSCFQYILLVIIYAKGSPYRRHMFSNWMFMINLVLLGGVSLWFIIYPTDPIAEFLELRVPETFEFRGYIIALGVSNLLLSLLIEQFIFSDTRVTLHTEKKCCPRRHEKKYLVLDQEAYEETGVWPPLQGNSQGFADLL